MYNKSRLDLLYSLALEHKLFRRKESLAYHFKDVFQNVKLENKNVLDIGGGIGLLSFFAGLMGARKTVCLEPQSDGSSSDMIDNFKKFKSVLGEDLPVEHLPLTLQQYLLKPSEHFDVVILNNSINHLNEDACIHLKKSKDSYNYYVEMFATLFKSMNAGGQLIITDCSNKNFYNDIGMTSPFVNSIEWHKHQSPQTWAKLLKQVGFSNPTINWSSPHRLGDIGRILMKNSVSAYLTSSHFRLVVEKTK
jgi:hypothetical protein